ncbi:MAG: hypothetical protein WCD13_04690, partial [Pseudolabrys sp.]
MPVRNFAFGRWLAAAAFVANLCAAAIAAPPPAPKPAPAAAQKKDAPKKDEPNISAPHAMLIDGENGAVLF